MAEAGCCESCSHWKQRKPEPDVLYRVCEIHRDPIVQKTIIGDIAGKTVEELAGFYIVDPQRSICNRYAPNYVSIYIEKFFNRFRKKDPNAE